jgi:hypothetical protein
MCLQWFSTISKKIAQEAREKLDSYTPHPGILLLQVPQGDLTISIVLATETWRDDTVKTAFGVSTSSHFCSTLLAMRSWAGPLKSLVLKFLYLNTEK